MAAQLATTAGIAASIVLVAIFGFALWRIIGPLPRMEVLGVVLFLAALLVVKAAVTTYLTGFYWDVDCFHAWAQVMATGGPTAIYLPSPDAHLNEIYPPGYLYGSWASGEAIKFLNASPALARALMAAPALLADWAIALTLFALFRKKVSAGAAWAGMLVFAFNPAALFDTTVWKQVDSACAMPMLLSLAAALGDHLGLAWTLMGLALLTKPQAVCFLPVLALWTIVRFDWRAWVSAGWRAGLTMVVIVLPFFIGHPLGWFPSTAYLMIFGYHVASVNAFNLMSLLAGLQTSDTGLFLVIRYFRWGIGLTALLYGWLLWSLLRKPSRSRLTWVSFLAIFGAFLCLPRMHERYGYAALVFAMPLLFEGWLPALLVGALTLTNFVNIAYVYSFIEWMKFLPAYDPVAVAVSIVNLLMFGMGLLGCAFSKDQPRL